MGSILSLLHQIKGLLEAGRLAEAFRMLLPRREELPPWASGILEGLWERWEAWNTHRDWPEEIRIKEEKSIEQEMEELLRELLREQLVEHPNTVISIEQPRSLLDVSAETEPPGAGGWDMAEPPAPQPPVLQALKPEAGDTVVCSAFAPPQAKPGDDIMVQVWAHLPEKRQEAAAFAAGFDPGTTMRQFRTLSAPFEQGDEITFALSAKDIEIENKEQSLTWQGQTESVQFLVSVPADFSDSKMFFTLTAYKSALPVGQLLFNVSVGQAPAMEAQPLGDEVRRFRKAFVSYSSKDRPEVLRRVQMLGIFDMDYFMDLLSLDPGERWEKGLYKNINTCDVFLLFWSSHAKESKWVLQELEYAIARKQGDENHPPLIQPVPIEGPPVVAPPPQLGHMHFNDKILYFIEATPAKP